MSGNDENDDGGRLVPFPRVVFPGSFDAPSEGSDPDATADDDGPPAGVWSRLPQAGDMAPPLALTMPGTPDPGDEDDAFTPPQPGDPDRPKAGETLAVAVALMTALGVAAAKGMWHRARHRQALADQARANADRATQKAAAGRGCKDSAGSKGSSLLRSTGSSERSRSRPSGGKNRPPKDAHGGSRNGPGRGGKAPKADRDGKNVWDRDKRKRRKRDKDKDGLRWRKRRDKDAKAPKTKGAKPPKSGAPGKDTPGTTPPKKPKKPREKLRWKARKGDRKRPAGWTSGRPGGKGKGSPKRERPGKPNAGKLRWKAPKRRPGPDGDRAITGRKRWAGRKSKPTAKRRPASWTRRASKARTRWVKRWRSSRRTARRTAKSWPRWSWKTSRRGADRGWARSWAAGQRGDAGAGTPGFAGTGAPPPPPGWEGMRPPPAADRTVRVERVERVYDQPQPGAEPLVLAGAPAGGRRALPAAAAPAPSSPSMNGARLVATSARMNTQYADAELTIFDVIDADADMAEEITDGVGEAQRTADGCELLLTRLEALHAKVVELKVPGVLEGMVVRLMEKTAVVRSRALAIADKLPAASEAIAVAGANAAARHRPLADAVRDAGHVRPAERDYHND